MYLIVKGIIDTAFNLFLVVVYSLLIGAVVAGLVTNLNMTAGPMFAFVWAGVRIGVWLCLQALLLWLLVEGLKTSCRALYTRFKAA